jgi:3-oxoacyl-[acyl-carrier protein] reductase
VAIDRLALPEPHPRTFLANFIRVDLADRATTATMLDKIVSVAAVDAVVNNVGFAHFGRIGSIDLDQLFDTYDLNVRTAVQVVQAVLPGMLAAGWDPTRR